MLGDWLMGSIMAEMGARIVPGEDFSLGASSDPYQKKLATWGSNKPKYEVLIYQATGGD